MKKDIWSVFSFYYEPFYTYMIIKNKNRNEFFLFFFLSSTYFSLMTIPVIDVAKTSEHLKQLREDHNVKVSQLQSLFNMENPQSIYNWENPDMKNLPRIDNLVILAKFYNVKIDDLIVIKKENTECLSISEESCNYGVSLESIFFIKEYSSSSVLDAITRYYDISI